MAPAPTTVTDWEAEGARVAEALYGRAAAVVVGSDPEATARVALGIGRVQARRRRVAVGDLFGETQAFQSLVPEDATHGLVDSFLYGVSLNKIAHAVDPAKNLFVMPSGAGPIEHEALLRSERWRKLTSGFREVDALLLLAAPADAPGLAELVATTDGIVTVGEVADEPGPVLARVRVERPEPIPARAPEPEPEPAAPEAVPEPAESAEVAPTVAAAPSLPETPEAEPAPEPTAPRQSRTALWVGLAAILLLLAGGIYLWLRLEGTPRATTTPASARASAPAPAAPAAPATAAPRPDSAPPEAAGPVPVIANPSDSASASGWVLSVTNLIASEPAAMRELEERYAGLPAATFTPMRSPDGASWQRLTIGSFRARASADSAVETLRTRARPVTGRALYAPLSLLVWKGIPRLSARTMVVDFRGMALPVFGLLQPNGTVNLYAGAFERPEQAIPLISSFRADSTRTPVQLVYRTGSVF